MLGRLDFTLILLPACLALFGLATIFDFGSGGALFQKQLAIHCLGLLLAIYLAFLNPRIWQNSHYLLVFYLFSVFLLVAILAFGETINNAQSWFRFGGLSLQPVEIAKLALILVLAKFLSKKYQELSYLPTFLKSLSYGLLIFVLTVAQPDLGSALVVLFIWFFMVWVSGMPKKYLLVMGAVGLVSAALAWNFFLETYQKERVLSFLDPTRDIRGSGYNVYQSMIAIGSGGLWGKGINMGSQSKLAFLPEYETDFIFAAFAEEWGFLGVVICLSILFFLIWRILYLSKVFSESSESLFALGVAGYFIAHVLINVGMNMGLLPVTGIPLPFMSAGGTHVLVEWAMIGILLSMNVPQPKKFGVTVRDLF